MHIKNEQHLTDGGGATSVAFGFKYDKSIQVPHYMWDIMIITSYKQQYIYMYVDVQYGDTER